jgi:hypothetical protein
MSASVVTRDNEKIVVRIEVPVKQSMLEGEEALLQSLNEAGALVTGELLNRFDVDGTPIVMGDIKYTKRSIDPKPYQTPYGEVTVERCVYQTSKGGSIYCPMEHRARIIGTSTPRFAKIVSSKYSALGAQEVVRDLAENHARPVARSFVKNLADLVGSIVETKEDVWSYCAPVLQQPVATVSLGLDGTTIRMDDGSYREAMVGSIGLYDNEGERMYTVYCGAAPEYGKQIFLDRFDREIRNTKRLYPSATYLGVADGAPDNWTFLEKHTDLLVLDFYHASEYLTGAMEGVFSGTRAHAQGYQWLQTACHDLKHKMGAASRLLLELTGWKSLKLSQERMEKVKKAVTYFANNKNLMGYYSFVKRNLPIGSGVTEAACKTIIKQRLCKSGMKWKLDGAAKVISLRCLAQTGGRWNQFWQNIDQYGGQVEK